MNPPRPYRSKLIPFEAEIVALRRSRPPTPYSKIVRLLKESHGLTVQVSTLFNFLKVRRKWDRDQSLAKEPRRVASRTSAPAQQMTESKLHCAALAVPAAPARSAEPVPRRSALHPKPAGRALKSFTPSAEYNLERLTPEQMAEWLEELKREQGG
jgi:hypothetical protein